MTINSNEDRTNREQDLTFDLARYLERPALAEGSTVSIRATLRMLLDEGFDPDKAYRLAKQATPEWPDCPHPPYDQVKPN